MAGEPDAEPLTEEPEGGGPALFRVGCPHCAARGQLPSGELRLVLGRSRATTFYTFTCPECGSAVRKPAGERIVELLTARGVPVLRPVGGAG